ncbi:MAG TPA: efflux RND transporter periplasmic adaptor subunit [bacterium]|nr:efflux RND transporter periplasmic adaptor subunit [bacterium]
MFKSKKKIITIALIIIAILAVIFLTRGKNNQAVYTTVKAEIMDLQQTVDATGQVESAETIKLNFKNYGRLEKVFVEEGAQVKQGDKLAALDSKALNSQVADARARLTQATADYEKLLAGASSEDLQISIDTVAQREQSWSAAQNSLIVNLNKRDADLNNLKETALDTLKSEITVADGALEEINNTLNDADAKDTLAIKNSSILKITQENYNQTVITLEENKTEIDWLNSLKENEVIFTALDNLKTSLTKISTVLTNSLNVLEATLTSSNLTEAELDSLKNNIKTQQIKINTSLASVQAAKANWNNKIIYYLDAIASYENAVKEAESALSIARSQLDLKKSPPRSFEIQAGKARVDQARANLDLALANLNDAQIIAPVDGTITKKNFQVGEQTSLSTPVLEMIGKSNLQVKVNIPESDIAKIKLAQNVDMTLDAFGADKKFAGQVVMIDPAETKIQDVVYYQVKVQFNNNFEEVKPGMTANLIILIEQRNQVLVVPSRAIKSRNDEKYVEILENLKEVKEKTVTVGIKGDEGTEIISGLSVGEEVITFVKN